MSKKESIEFIEKIIALPVNNWDDIINAISKAYEVPVNNVLTMISNYIVNGHTIHSASDLKQILLQEFSRKSGKDLTIDIIVYYFNIKRENIFQLKNKGICGYSKQIVIFFLYYHNGLSRKQIADIFSIKETSVRYSIKKVRKYIEIPVYKKDIKTLSEYLGAKYVYYKLISKNLFGNKKMK